MKEGEKELFQDDLTKELTIKNSNMVINLAAALEVLENSQFLSPHFLVPISPQK